MALLSQYPDYAQSPAMSEMVWFRQLTVRNVYSKITKETGRIVRIAEIEGRLAYVVAMKREYGQEMEALWRPGDCRRSASFLHLV
jgi:hypothetical protein